MADFDQISKAVGGMFGFGEKVDPGLDQVKTATQEALTDLKVSFETERMSNQDRVQFFLDLMLKGQDGQGGLMLDFEELGLNAAQQKEFEDEFIRRFMDDPEELDEKVVSNSIELEQLNRFVDRFAGEFDPLTKAIQAGAPDKITAFVTGVRDAHPEFAALVASLITVPEVKEGEKMNPFDAFLAKVVGILGSAGQEASAENPAAPESRDRLAAAKTETRDNYLGAINALKPNLLQMMGIVNTPRELGFFEDEMDDPNPEDHMSDRLAVMADYVTGILGIEGYEAEVQHDGVSLVKGDERVDVVVERDKETGSIMAYNEDRPEEKHKFDGTPEGLKKVIEDNEMV